MSESTGVGKSEEVGEGEMTVFDVGGQRVAVANTDGSFHAYGSQFDVTTGEVLNPPATEPVPVSHCRSRATRFGWRCDG